MSAPWLTRMAPRTAPPVGVIPADVKAIVDERSGLRCECCGRSNARQFAYHHRRPKGMGGSRDSATHTPANVVLVCDGCHKEIHAYPIEARAHGWLVRQGATPSRVPLLLHDGRTVFLGRTYDIFPEGHSA